MFTAKFNASSILIKIILRNYLNLLLANEYFGDLTIPTQVIKYKCINKFFSRWISQSDCSIHITLNYKYDRIRSVRTQIGVHSSNRQPLMSLSQITVWFKGIIKAVSFQILRSMAYLLFRVRAYISNIIRRRFEKVRSGHRFENWTPIWEF